MNINLTNVLTTTGAEVIISESDGTVLLDTLSPFNGPLVATLKTNQSLVDFTYINYDSGGNDYYVMTYKAVNPSLWSSLEPGQYWAPIGPMTPTTGAVYYKNVPNVSLNYFWLNDYVGSSGGSITSQGPGYLGLTYTKYGDSNYVYLLFPESGLYNIHLPQSPTDTVDLSHMDTAVIMSFNVPAQYTVNSTTLVGIMDTTNYARSLILYENFPGLPEMEYPAKGVQKYESSVSAQYGNNGYAGYFSYGDSVPSTIPFPAGPVYTITSPLYSEFTVQFNASTPTYYQSYWANSKVQWALNYSPDSANINPQKLLTSLNSKMLQGQDLSTMPTHSFGYTSSPGMVYADWWTYLFNPAQQNAKRVNTVLSFDQSF
jgi:hypothetical protein